MQMYNYHFEVERKARRIFIADNIGYGNIVATVRYRGKTSSRARINTLSDTGIITVYTEQWQVVTVHIANYEQACIIYRKAHGSEPPEYLKDKFRTAQQWKEFEP